MEDIPEMIIPVLVFIVLAAVVYCDLKTGLIPDELSLGFTISMLGLAFLEGLVVQSLLLGSVSFIVAYLLMRVGLGGGDVKILPGVMISVLILQYNLLLFLVLFAYVSLLYAVIFWKWKKKTYPYAPVFLISLLMTGLLK
jgi:Flp pilus assembly protein protease CpaA